MNTSLIKLCALLFILPVFIACRQKKAHPVIAKPAPAVGSTAGKDVFSQNPARYYFDYDSTKDDMYNLNNGYIDTFSIAGTRFRFRFNRDTADDDYLEMQVYKNDRWMTNFRTFYANNGNIHEEDFNNDGFTDFQQLFSHVWTRVYLYDPAGKKFADSALSVTAESEPIDKKANVYYDLRETGGFQWMSVLYRFQGVQWKFLYTLNCAGGKEPDNGPTVFRLYKCMHNDPEDTVFIKEFRIKRGDDFDVKKYWQAFIRSHRNL